MSMSPSGQSTRPFWLQAEIHRPISESSSVELLLLAGDALSSRKLGSLKTFFRDRKIALRDFEYICRSCLAKSGTKTCSRCFVASRSIWLFSTKVLLCIPLPQEQNPSEQYPPHYRWDHPEGRWDILCCAPTRLPEHLPLHYTCTARSVDRIS